MQEVRDTKMIVTLHRKLRTFLSNPVRVVQVKQRVWRRRIKYAAWNCYIDWIRRSDHQYLEAARAKWPLVFLDDRPLVSVVIPTYNRAAILAERTLPSVLNQTYQNFEIIVVGDHCTDDTAERLQALQDPRIVFHNLPERGKYPKNPKHRRAVAGVDPLNKAHQLANGDWLAHLDDDDVWKEDHLETMLKFVSEHQHEFAFGITLRERVPGDWFEVEGHSTFFYSRRLKAIPYMKNCWYVGLTADTTMRTRLERSGVNVGRLQQVTAYAPLRPGITRYDHLAEDRD